LLGAEKRWTVPSASFAQGEEMPKRAAHLHFEDLFIANLKAPLTIDASAAAV
jgi:hypothetical protein